MFSLFSTLVLALSCLVNAAPVKRAELLAFAPTIVFPNNRTIWATASTQNVTWLTTNVPDAARNYTVTVLLGFLANDSENLNIRHPLAAQVPIMQGSVVVAVPPNLISGTNYVVAAIGESGDISPPFTITS